MADNIAILKKYNFWDGMFPDLGFIRRDYLDKIRSFTGNRLVKVLVGQRRAGKSVILRQTIKDLVAQGVSPANIFYLNKEYTDFDFVSDYKDLDMLIKAYLELQKPHGKVYLFVDEVQDIAGWERLVNSYAQNHVDNYEVFISGSNAHMLSGELATLLSGRYVEMQVFTFQYEEYVAYLELEKGKASFLAYLKSGGLPELFMLPNDEVKRNYLSAIRDAILLRDVVQRFNIKDTRLLEDVFAFLVNNASNLVSVNTLVNYFASKNRKTNYETLSNYISHLSGAFIIHQAERYHIKGKDILSGNCKYYMNDLSFKNFLYPGFSYGYGYMLENLVYLQLRHAGYQVYVGYIRNREIDFVAIKNDRTIYIQSAYMLNEQTTIDREYSQLEAIPDHHEKYVVSLDDLTLPNRGGIRHIQAWNLTDSVLH